MTDNRWALDERRNEVMKNYELVDNGYYCDVLPRGMYAMYTLPVALDSVKTGIEALESGADSVYGEMTDGEVPCYVRNVDLEKMEIELVPMTAISYEQYIKAMESDRIVELEGEMFIIQYDGQLTEDTDLLTLFGLPGQHYAFYEPTAEKPVSVIHNMRKKAPVKLKISKDIEFVTEASSEVCSMAIDDYFSNYAVNYNGGYYSATVADNEVVELKLNYRP